MIYLPFVVLGIMLGFLSYSCYFVSKVSKGLTMRMLYNLLYKDPIEDILLHYTFYNLFWCRVCLYVSCLAVVGVGSAYYAYM